MMKSLGLSDKFPLVTKFVDDTEFFLYGSLLFCVSCFAACRFSNELLNDIKWEGGVEQKSMDCL